MTKFDTAFDQAYAKSPAGIDVVKPEVNGATHALQTTFRTVEHFNYDPTRLVVSTTIVGEQYRTLKANLSRLKQAEGISNVVFSSSVKGEGKTTVVLNVAREFARERGAKIAVVDCDFKRPGIARFCGVEPEVGIEAVFAGDASLEECGVYSRRDNFTVFSVKKRPGETGEILTTSAVERVMAGLESTFDFIFYDTSPVLSTSEPLVIGGRAGVVLVVRANSTQRESVLYAQGQLEQAGCRLLGLVLNARPSYVPRFWLLRKYDYFPDAYRYKAT